MDLYLNRRRSPFGSSVVKQMASVGVLWSILKAAEHVKQTVFSAGFAGNQRFFAHSAKNEEVLLERYGNVMYNENAI